MQRLAYSILLVVGGACGTDQGPAAGPPDPPPVGDELRELPCDVEAALTPCLACHGRPLAQGAPMALATHADLTRRLPAGIAAEVALERMRSETNPMPPLPAARPADDHTAALETWIAAGMPRGSCSAEPPPPPPPPDEPDPFAVPPQCSSTVIRPADSEGTPLMHPGHACLTCHQSHNGPRLPLAGTVYPTGHEPDDCVGATGAIVVEITAADGAVFALPVNESGNFHLPPTTSITFPIRARVLANGRVRAMVAPQMTGDCNSCHTQDGANDAPGRIVAP